MKFFITLTTSLYIALVFNSSYAVDMNSKIFANQIDSVFPTAVIDVEYDNTSATNIDWKVEIEQARITHTLDNKGIRITLPNSDPAKVIITNEKGTKVLRTISYVAPAVIDISKLRKGNYQLIIEIHGIVKVKTFEKESKWECCKKKQQAE
jgi:hypothetical protein